MAIIGNTYLGLIDLYKGQNVNGDTIAIIEMLRLMNPMLEDAVTVPCNQGTQHVHAIRTGLPSSTWGMLYKGVQKSKSTKQQVVDTTGFVESASAVDERLLEIAKDGGKALRLSEAMAHMESMSNEVQSKIIYGNSAADPEQFMGLAPRFNSLSAANGNQIIDAGGTGSDNTSVWFIGWGENTCHLLHPESAPAGLSRTDRGKQQKLDADGNAYYVMEETFRWHIGVALKDWRYVARVANIDVSEMRSGAVKLYDFLAKAYYRLQSRRVPYGKMVMYCHREVLEALDRLARNAGSADNFVRLSYKEVQGEEVLMYRGIPIRECDALLLNEARVV